MTQLLLKVAREAWPNHESMKEMPGPQISSFFIAQHLMAIKHLRGTEQRRVNSREANIEHLPMDVSNTTAGIIDTMTPLYTGAMV